MSWQWVTDWTNFNNVYMLVLALPLLAILYRRLASSLFKRDISKGVEVTGESGVPILGYLPVHYKPLRELFEQLSSKHGEIFKVHIFGRDYFVLNSYRSVKEAFVTQGNNFISRPSEFTVWGWVTDYKGITMSYGESWLVQRQFVVQSMRNHGMGSSSLEPSLLNITSQLLEYVEQTKGQPTNFHDILALSVVNVISKLLCNKMYALDDEEYLSIKDSNLTIFKKVPGLVGSLSGPWVRLLLANPLFEGYRVIAEKKRNLYDVVYRIIQEHLSQYDNNYVDIDYMDNFIREMNAEKHESFELHRLASVTCIMFLAGLDTTLNTLYFSLNLLAKYPDVQTKMQNEIDEVIGQGQPTYNDRLRLKYVSAVIKEINRYIVLVPFGLVHVNNEETTVCGYRIPKRSNILPNFWTYLRDAAVFPNPDSFDPNNMLDECGNAAKHENYIPFSIGKRVCPGEQMAMMEMFFIITTLLQKYTLKPPPGQEVRHEVFEGLVRSLAPFEICAVARS